MMKCHCGSEYFGSQPIVQTAPDGRVNVHGSEVMSWWALFMTCAACGRRYIYPDKMRSGGKLVEAGSPEALKLIEENRIDFNKSMDPRQEKRDGAVA